MVTIALGSPHPVAWENPVVLRATAALLAGNAWDLDANLIIQNVAGSRSCVLYFTYTQADDPGAFDWQIDFSPVSVVGNLPAGADEWQTETIYAGGGVAVNVGTQSRVQSEYQTHGAEAAGAIGRAYGPVGMAGIERIRIRARESLVDNPAGNPGTLQITAEFAPW